VHALKRIHRSLRPDGVLLDLHPQPDRPRIEIWQDGRVELLGHIDYEQDIADILNARARLDQVEKDGWYVTYRRMVFELVSHFTSVEDWQTHEWWQGYDTRVHRTRSHSGIAAQAPPETGKRGHRTGCAEVKSQASRPSRAG
jgi:SAM-dependent methyltransferase